MLKTVRDLGEFLVKSERKDRIDTLIEMPKLASVSKVICVVSEKKDDEISYIGVHVEDFKESKGRKYLYRTLRHGRYDITPTAKPGSLEKLRRRWELWFKHAQENNFWGEKLIKSLSSAIVGSNGKIKTKIFDSIVKECKHIPKKTGVIFTIKIKESGKEKYLGDFDAFKEIFKTEAIRKSYYKHGVESKGEGTCYLCGGNKEVIPGSPFSIYTVDKVGFAPQFSQEDSWKQLPLCEDCVIFAQEGKKFLDKHLSYPLYGLWYYVIPNFIFTNIEKEVVEKIVSYEDSDYRGGLLSEEDPSFGIFGKKNDVLNLIFVFYKPKQKDYFDIVKYVEEVPPSWMKRVDDEFNATNKKSIFKEKSLKKIFGKKWSNDFKNGEWDGDKLNNMNLGGMVKTFFPSSKKTGIHEKDFTDLLGNILAQNPVRYRLLIKNFIREIRSKHIEEAWAEKLYTLKSLYLLHLVNVLGLTEAGDVSMHKNFPKKVNDPPSASEEFFNEFSMVFNMPEKRAAFLMGVVTGFLMDIQLAKKDSAPFRKKLAGLRLDKIRLKRLWAELDDKFAAYEAERRYESIRELTAQYLIKAENSGWKMSKDEINYFFVLGLHVHKSFKKEKEEREVK